MGRVDELCATITKATDELIEELGRITPEERAKAAAAWDRLKRPPGVLVRFPCAERVVRTIEVGGGAVDLVESEHRPPGDVLCMTSETADGTTGEPTDALWAVMRAPGDALIGSDAGDLWKDEAIKELVLSGLHLWDARA